MDFAGFKSNIAVTHLLSALGFRDQLEASRSYIDLKSLIRRAVLGDHESYGDAWTDLEQRVDTYASHCSTGEGVVLAAVLYLLGYDMLADRLDEGCTWRRMHRVSGDHLAAVCACIVQDVCLD